MDGLVLSRNVEVGDAVSSILVLGSQATPIMELGDVFKLAAAEGWSDADTRKALQTLDALKSKLQSAVIVLGAACTNQATPLPVTASPASSPASRSAPACPRR